MGDENRDWLPSGWTVTVKVRNYGRKDKYYINPSNGLKFNSRAEVLRYLKSFSGEVPQPKDQNKVDIETFTVEKLPPGWIKEVRTIKKRGRTRKEPCYVDPVSGREFRSLQEVFQYLKTEDLGQTKHKTDEEDQITAKLEDHSQSSSAEVIDNKGDITISRCKRVNSEVKVGGSSVGSAMDTLNVAENNEHKEEDDCVAMEVSDKLQQPVSRSERDAYRIRKRESDGGYHISNSDDVVEEINAPETNSSEQTREHNSVGNQLQENAANPPTKTKKKNRKSASELPRRTSKRLAHVEVDPSLQMKPTKKPRATTATLPGKVQQQVINTDDNGLNGNLDEPEIIVTSEIGNLCEPNQQNYMNSISDKQKELVRSLFEDPCCSEEDLDGVCVEIKADEKLDMQAEPALENLLMDSCYGFAIKTLKGDIPIEDVKKNDNNSNNTVCSLATPNEVPASSSVVLPAGNIWDDPSFEFAVKMLTSDHLPAKDGSHFSISFQQPPTSSVCNGLALTKPRLGDSNDLFSGFGSEKKLHPLPHNNVNGSSSSSEQFQPFATGFKGQGRKFGEL